MAENNNKRDAKNRKEDWANFAATMKGKRLKRTSNEREEKKVDLGANIIRSKEMIVQQLDSQPSGVAMKYRKVGPQVFVEYDYDEISLDNIKKACHKHFYNELPTGMSCDIVASQNGPSCTKLSHITDFKKLFVRFVKDSTERSYGAFSSTSKSFSSAVYQRSPFEAISVNTTSRLPAKSVALTHKTKSTTKHTAPKSLSIASMLRLGKVIKTAQKPPTAIEMYEFDIHKMSWSTPKISHFCIEETPLGQGGFRKVYKCTCEGKEYVLKRFLDLTIKSMDELNEHLEVKESPETLARKAIQMHALAYNFADQLRLSLSPEMHKIFGNTFSYNKAKLGKIIGDNEFVMIEDFICGHFRKYINNDGSIDEEKDELVRKAECLAHFSYQKSKKQLILLDIQGSGHTLFDPEIATAVDYMEQKELVFCMGNLSVHACVNFVAYHTCNEYCRALGLECLE